MNTISTKARNNRLAALNTIAGRKSSGSESRLGNRGLFLSVRSAL